MIAAPVPPVPTRPFYKTPANQRQCFIGRNRKERKRFVMWICGRGTRTVRLNMKDPIAAKRINRELRARGM